MMRRKGLARHRLLAAALVSLIGLISVEAMAQDVGWLSGVQIGQTKFKGYELESQADELDDSDSGWAVYGGYRWGHFAVTTGYTDLGALNAKAGSDYQPPEGDRGRVRPRGVAIPLGFQDKIEDKGLMVTGHGIIYASARVQLIGHLGLFRWKQKVTYREPGFDFNESASGTSAAYGAGVNIGVTRNGSWSILVDYMRHSKVGDLDKTGHENDVDMISVGTVYQFGRK